MKVFVIENKDKVYLDIGTLPDGEYHGKLSGHVFEYNGNLYKTYIGIKTPIPQPWTITIKDGKEVIPSYLNI